MKKALFCALLLCLLSVFSTHALASPYLNFDGIHGVNTFSTQFTLTTCTAPANCTSNSVLTTMTVTFQISGGSASCQPGQCRGLASGVSEVFSTPATAFALFSAPVNQATTITYWLQGHQVGPTQVQLGGMFNLQKSAHTVFDTVQFSWSKPTDFRFTSGSFDAVAVPEPSTLLLLGSGLVGMVGVVRRKLF